MSAESTGAKDRYKNLKMKVLANYGNMQPSLSDYWATAKFVLIYQFA